MIQTLSTEVYDPTPALFLNPNAAQKVAESFCESGEKVVVKPFIKRGQVLGYLGLVQLRNGQRIALRNDQL